VFDFYWLTTTLSPLTHAWQPTEARSRTLIFDFFGNGTGKAAKTVPKGQVRLDDRFMHVCMYAIHPSSSQSHHSILAHQHNQQVTSSGIVVYDDASFFLQTGVPVVMAVTGGSLGWYGATGQLTTIRQNAQGDHTQTLDITYSNYKPGKAGAGSGKGYH
jgi:hypothetical protein